MAALIPDESLVVLASCNWKENFPIKLHQGMYIRDQFCPLQADVTLLMAFNDGFDI